MLLSAYRRSVQEPLNAPNSPPMARRLTGSQEVFLHHMHLLYLTAGLTVRFLLGAHKLDVQWGCRVMRVCVFLSFSAEWLLE